jgi:hypothetical protein
MMEKYLSSKFKNAFIFWKKNLFVLLVWKLTLGYNIHNRHWFVSMRKRYHKKERFLNSKVKENKVCLATQVSEPPNYYIWTFINSLFWQVNTTPINSTSYTQNLQYKLHPLHVTNWTYLASSILIPIVNILCICCIIFNFSKTCY